MHPSPRYENDDQDEDEFAHEPPPIVTAASRAIRFAKWMANLFIVLLLIALADELTVLQGIDTALAPYRSRLVFILGALIAASFVMFMGGILYFVLRGGRSGTLANTPRVVLVGVALAIVSLCALGIVAGPPGLKLLAMATAAFLAVRILISTIRRTRHTPSGRRSARTPPRRG